MKLKFRNPKIKIIVKKQLLLYPAYFDLNIDFIPFISIK